MAKLGYTWFTKDWRSNMDVAQLSLQEKGFYRELIDECYLQGSKKIQINERTFCRLHGINSRSFSKLLQNLSKTLLITIENETNNTVVIHSVSKRIKKIVDKKGDDENHEKQPSKPKVKVNLNPKESKYNFRKSLLDYGFEENLVIAWLEIRKKKKAVNSEIAFNGFIREIEKVEQSPINSILKVIIEKSWSGFEAGWIANKKGNDGTNNKRQNTLTSLAEGR